MNSSVYRRRLWLIALAVMSLSSYAQAALVTASQHCNEWSGCQLDCRQSAASGTSSDGSRLAKGQEVPASLREFVEQLASLPGGMSATPTIQLQGSLDAVTTELPLGTHTIDLMAVMQTVSQRVPRCLLGEDLLDPPRFRCPSSAPSLLLATFCFGFIFAV